MTEPNCVSQDLVSVPGPNKMVACSAVTGGSSTTTSTTTADPNTGTGGSGCSASIVSRAPCRIADMRYVAHNWRARIVTPNYGGQLNTFQPIAAVGSSHSYPSWCATPANFPVVDVGATATINNRFLVEESLSVEALFMKSGSQNCGWRTVVPCYLYYNIFRAAIGGPPIIQQGLGVISNVQVAVDCAASPITIRITGTLLPAPVGFPQFLGSQFLIGSGFYTSSGCPLHTLTGGFELLIQDG